MGLPLPRHRRIEVKNSMAVVEIVFSSANLTSASTSGCESLEAVSKPSTRYLFVVC